MSARDALASPDPEPASPAPPPAPRRLVPVPASERTASVATPGAYLGGDPDHRVSFSVLEDRIRNLRVDGRQMATTARIVDGKIRAQHLGFELVAEWVDASHVEGRVRMRGRWGRGVTFPFSARLRVGDVLAG